MYMSPVGNACLKMSEDQLILSRLIISCLEDSGGGWGGYLTGTWGRHIPCQGLVLRTTLKLSVQQMCVQLCLSILAVLHSYSNQLESWQVSMRQQQPPSDDSLYNPSNGYCCARNLLVKESCPFAGLSITRNQKRCSRNQKQYEREFGWSGKRDPFQIFSGSSQ